MDDYSAYKAASNITIPVLVIHDADDADVSVQSAYHIEKKLIHSELLITKGLGHRKILGDAAVIEKINSFLA
jgi:pimeloyl-ACP methyl ester carboxylesterase